MSPDSAPSPGECRPRSDLPFPEAYFPNIVAEDAIISVGLDQRIRVFNRVRMGHSMN